MDTSDFIPTIGDDDDIVVASESSDSDEEVDCS